MLDPSSRALLHTIAASGFVFAFSVTPLGSVWASDPIDDVCDDPSEADLLTGTAWLRAVSLDLRGVVPTMEEYARVPADGSLPMDLVDEWLQSPEFADRAARAHRDLLWNALDGIQYFNVSSSFSITSNRYWRRQQATRQRGSTMPCGDWENQLKPDGRPAEIRVTGGLRDDGWVWVTPYWSETPIRVCTLDAQPAAMSPRGTDCKSIDGLNDPDCGCGPNLAWCGVGTVNTAVSDALEQDIERRVKAVIQEDRPYTELLLGSQAWVNGPLVHYLTQVAPAQARIRNERLPYDPAVLPDLTYADVDTWVPVDLGPEQAGVLTSPAFLLRFQTNRSRANRFWSAFLCQDFQAPPGGLPADGAAVTLDLTARDGCKYCHALLEPGAAHWGRWSETGASYLDPTEFPEYDAACARCGDEGIGCETDCRRYYVTDPLGAEEDPYLGWLAPYKFLEDRHHHVVDQGPALLVQQAIGDGRLAACTVRQTARRLIGREPATAEYPDDTPWMEELSAQLVSSGWSYRSLVKAVVTSPNYRRVP
jgi:hypothetical protein